MTDIPVLAVTSDKDNNLLFGHIRFDSLTPYTEYETDFQSKVRSIVSGFTERQPILVMDVKGLQTKNINPVLLKKLKIHGANTWYLTNIETVDDVFDAFNTDAERVLMPCNTVRSEYELEDILRVSDSIMPVLFVRGGMTQLINKRYRPSDAADDLFDMGFTSIAVFDIDRTVSPEEWSRMRSLGKVIPFTHSNYLPDGFDTVFREIL